MLAIPLTPAYTVDPVLWTPFKSASGEFTVLMPGAVEDNWDNSVRRYYVKLTRFC